MHIIDIGGLKKSFGKIEALRGIDFSVQKGEFFGLLGPNGAGKTTTINILSTIVSPDEGRVTINGYNLHTNPAQCKNAIGIVPQELALYNDLTALENLVFWGKLYGINKSEAMVRAGELLKIFALDDRKNTRIKTFSGGMKRRINIAAAMIHQPEILLMDEPTVGVDPQSRNQIYEVLTDFLKKGVTIVYTTHYMDEVEKLCSRVAIIDHGKIIAGGTMNELRDIAGSDENIHIVFENPDYARVENLKTTFGDRLTGDDGQIVLNSSNSRHDLPLILQKCAEANLQVNHVSVEKASLESIFLKLTGRKLRE